MASTQASLSEDTYTPGSDYIYLERMPEVLQEFQQLDRLQSTSFTLTKPIPCGGDNRTVAECIGRRPIEELILNNFARELFLIPFFNMLRYNETIKRLTIDCKGISAHCEETCLMIGRAFLSALAKNTVITSLTLTRCNQPAVIRALACGIINMPSKHNDGRDKIPGKSQLKHLVLSQCDLARTASILRTIEFTSSLVSLNILNCRMDAHTLTNLAYGLRGNKTLTTFSMPRHSFPSLDSLATAIKNHPSLTSVTFGPTQISSTSPLMTAFEQNPRLLHIEITSLNEPEAVAIKIDDVLTRTREQQLK